MKPVLQAILVADNVYEDRSSGKRIVAGIFNSLGIAPAGTRSVQALGCTLQVADGVRAGSPFAYISLTNAQGRLPLELRYVDLADNSVLFKMTSEVECRDPLATIEFAIPLPSLPVPHPGMYVLELLSDDDLLGSHRISVVEFPVNEVQS